MFSCRRAVIVPGAKWLSLSSSKQMTCRGSLLLSLSSSSTRRSMATSSTMDRLKELRTLSGAPMVECKKALEQSVDGDISQALDWLRQHGVAKATHKLQGRHAAEGLVGLRVGPNGESAALVQVSSETDFAGRSQVFVDLVTHVADATLHSSSTTTTMEPEQVMSLKHDSKTVQQVLDEAILAIRENLGVASAMKLESSQGGCWVGYVHGRVDSSEVAGTAAAVVHLAPRDPAESHTISIEKLNEVGKKLAMHVVAAKPLYLNPEHVPEAVLEKERDILMQQMADSGKPVDILAKIVEGRLRKFYEGVCLTEQLHMVEEGNPKVSKLLGDLGIVVTRFEAKSVS